MRSGARVSTERVGCAPLRAHTDSRDALPPVRLLRNTGFLRCDVRQLARRNPHTAARRAASHSSAQRRRQRRRANEGCQFNGDHRADQRLQKHAYQRRSQKTAAGSSRQAEQTPQRGRRRAAPACQAMQEYEDTVAVQCLQYCLHERTMCPQWDDVNPYYTAPTGPLSVSAAAKRRRAQRSRAQHCAVDVAGGWANDRMGEMVDDSVLENNRRLYDILKIELHFLHDCEVVRAPKRRRDAWKGRSQTIVARCAMQDKLLRTIPWMSMRPQFFAPTPVVQLILEFAAPTNRTHWMDAFAASLQAQTEVCQVQRTAPPRAFSWATRASQVDADLWYDEMPGRIWGQSHGEATTADALVRARVCTPHREGAPQSPLFDHASELSKTRCVSCA